MYRQLLLSILLTFIVGYSNAQQRTSMAMPVSTPDTATGKYFYTSSYDEPPRAVSFDRPTIATQYFLTNINNYFGIPPEFSFVEIESNTDHLGMRHRLMQQYYKGIPLENLGYRVHEKNGFVTSANGKAVHTITLDANVILNDKQAFRIAIDYLQSNDTVFRDAKKLIVSEKFTYRPESFAVAYQFDIDVSLGERWRISIDARSGKIINKISLVNTCFEDEPGKPLVPYGQGTGLTSYYGRKAIRVEQHDGNYRLVGETEHGGKIGTYDARNFRAFLVQIFNIPKVDFISADTTFNNHYFEPAVSAQWGAEQVFEYFYNQHNRNSFDNLGSEISSFVHVDERYNNAFWNGRILAFGDGSNNNPLVELDIVSHEFTHGVTQYEAALQYAHESGALNESFSDIFAKAVEFNVFGDTATWQLGKYFRAAGVRDMSNPNLKNHPDTYGGDFWHNSNEDNGGVHVNSGVQNFWFYLLCESGSGVNDQGASYTVNAIGMDTAVQIAYRNLTEYLSPTADYLDSRIGSMLATIDLYGKNSTIYQEVDKAWDAVGVIMEPIITSFELFDITATTVKMKGSLQPRGDTVTYHFEYGTSPAFGNLSSVNKYTDSVEGILTGLQSETKYYLRLVATNENGNSYSSTLEFTTLSLVPLVKLKHTVDVTETTATLYGKINPNSLSTSYYFEYGLTSAFGLVTPTNSLPDTTEYLSFSESITGLQPRQTYYYRLVATNGFAQVASETANFITAVKPVIRSFSPVTATVGTEITITGDNFNPIPEKNFIRFGAVKGAVLSSSQTEIKVTVPVGASYGPLTLTDSETGLVTESVHEFVPTFTGEFTKRGLQHRANFNDKPYEWILVQDMDGDAKPDIVAGYDEGFSVFQNVNSGGDITNESFIISSHPTEASFEFLSLVDFDGNGSKDVVGRYLNGLRIYPNKSVPGFMFFDVPVDLPIGYWRHIEFKDFDNDGHIDISGISKQMPGDTTLFTIFRNENSKGVLVADNFVKRYEKPILYFVYSFSSADINNDGTPDVLSTAYDSTYFSILKNYSQPGAFAFEESIAVDTTRARFAKYIAHDLNKDGLKDIISRSPDENERQPLRIFENSGILPSVKFAKSIVALDTYAGSVQPADMDGDGIIDLVVGSIYENFLLVKNKTEFGKHFADSLFTFELFGSGEGTSVLHSEIAINDMNGDGRPDVINNLSEEYHINSNKIQIWQNAPDDCPDPFLINLIVSTNSATILLPPTTTLDQFEIEYAHINDNYWTQVTTTTLTGLKIGNTYKVSARAKCYLGFTDYNTFTFTTECVDVSSFSVTNIQPTNVFLNANSIGSVEVQYSLLGKEQWKIVQQHSNQITNLLPGTQYDVRYRGRCYIPAEFKYTEFTTQCPTLSSLSVSNITDKRAIVNGTSNYAGNIMFDYSIDNSTWTPINETRTMFPLLPGQEYFVRGRMACTDRNSNFIFTSFTTDCANVSNLSVENITTTKAELSWDDTFADFPYVVDYSNVGNTSWQTVETTVMNIELNDLRPGTKYEVQVRIKCLSEISPHVSLVFETDLYGETMYAPNPTDGIITILPSKNLIGNPFIIYDDMGRTAASGVLRDYTFDLTSYSAGIYILKIDGERPIKIIKLD